MDCIFCKIISGEIPAAKVYESNKAIVILDISPVNKGHMLVIPKAHSRNLLEDDLADLKECMAVVQKVAPAAMEGLGAQGFNLIANTNSAAGQVVMHTHFHVIPRYEGDGLRHWPQGKLENPEEVKLKIINHLGGEDVS